MGSGLGMTFTLPWLALRSLANRRLTTFATVLTIGLSVTLLFGVNHTRRSARASFEGVISGTDLIVGPRGGGLQLLLYAVFHLGSPTANIPYAGYREIAADPAVAWTIPISLGDSHRGFRVVATNADFYAHYRFHGDRRVTPQEGRFPQGLWDVAIGSAVAEALDYAIGDPLVVTHGISSVGILNHDDKPFTLVGILEPTGTPIDRSVFVTLEGFEAMHIDWQSGAPPRPGERISVEALRPEDIRIDAITAFLLGTRARIETLQLQRAINTREAPPLMAIIPGVTLGELWRVVGYGENALLLVSAFVVGVGLLGMLLTIYTSLDARRRETAILRALGSGRRSILGLLLLEAGLLSLSGAALGLALFYALLTVTRPFVERELGLVMPLGAPSPGDWLLLATVVLAGTAMGLPPAWKAYRNALSDGLTVRL